MFDKDGKYVDDIKFRSTLYTNNTCSGYVSCQELRMVLMDHGEMKLTKQEVEEMIDLVDIDNDDRIKYSEFVKLFTEHIDL